MDGGTTGPVVITKGDARVQGLKRFFTGQPCRHGHIAERLVSDGKCMECAREQQRTRPRTPEQIERQRQQVRDWQAANRDRDREHQKAYREGRGSFGWGTSKGDIIEPQIWARDDHTRREPVVDPFTKRVIRLVGWRGCMCCQRSFFSKDVKRVRICDECKETRGGNTERTVHLFRASI